MINRLLSWFGYSRTLENPSIALDDPDLWETLGAKEASSGVRVNRKKALTCDTVWRAVSMISRDVAKLPLMVYQTTENGRERARNHPSYSILRHQANSEMTAFVWKQTMQAHAMLAGNAYSYIFRNGSGAISELIPLDPMVTFPLRANKKLWYVTQVDGVDRKLRPEDVWHLKGLGYDGMVGYDVVSFSADSIGLALAQSTYAGKFFSNQAVPPAVLEFPEKVSDTVAADILAGWAKMHAGLNNSHKTALLDQGGKVNVIGYDARKAQMIESRGFSRIEIANWFGLPPHKLGDNSRTAYNSLEQENQSYLTESLDGWLCAWEDECYAKCLTERQKSSESHTIEFMRQALVRADLKTRGEYYRLATGGNPWMSRNEVRRLENMNDVDGGDEIPVPLNMGDQGGADNQDNGQSDGTTDQEDDGSSRSVWVVEQEFESTDDGVATGEYRITKDSARNLLTDVATRMCRRIGHEARKASRKQKGFADFLDELMERNHVTVTESFEPAFAATFGGDNASDYAATFIGDARAMLDEVYSTATPAEFVERIDATCETFEAEKPTELVATWLGDE